MHSQCGSDSGDASGSLGSDEASDSDEESDNLRVQSDDGRGHVETADSDHGSSASSPEEAGGASFSRGAEQASDEAEAAEAPISKDILAGRFSAMFVIGSAGPQEVRTPLLARSVTKGLVKLAIEVANKLCDSTGKALSESFGNFDRRVALGWLLADALGLRLLDRAQAHAVGIKAQREGGYIKDAIKAARKEAGAAARAAGTDAPAAQDEAEGKILRDAAGDIALPQLPAAPPPAATATAAPSGSRKRAREHERSPLELVEEQIVAAGRALLKAEKAVLRAEAQEEKAEADSEAKAAACQRAVIRVQVGGEDYEEQAKLIRCAERKQQAAEAALLDEKDAEIATLRAKLAARDALIDEMQLVMQRSIISYEQAMGEGA